MDDNLFLIHQYNVDWLYHYIFHEMDERSIKIHLLTYIWNQKVGDEYFNKFWKSNFNFLDFGHDYFIQRFIFFFAHIY